MVALKSFRHSGPSFADLVPYAGLVDNGVVLLKCYSAWNKDPLLGVIGIQTGPLIRG